MNKKRKGRKYGVSNETFRKIRYALQQYEGRCDMMWDDMVGELAGTLHVSERTIERVLGSL